MLSNRQAIVEKEEQDQSSEPTPWSTINNVQSLQITPIREAGTSGPSDEAGSFQLFHKRGKALMNQGIEIQEAIRENRILRASSQRQLFRLYGEMSDVNTSVERCEDISGLILDIRDKINQLDTEHTALNKQFVCIQSRVLQTVKNQRNRLVKGIASTW